MADQAEVAFATTFLNTLSTQPVTYADDYQQPPENSLRRVPVLGIDLPPPPERKHEVISDAEGISVTIKSLKPAASFSLTIDPTDTISDLKSKLAAQPNAPPADVQRLLLKGKALVDTKLVKEYNVKNGDTFTLMFKPGVEWDPSKPTESPSSTPSIMLIDSSKTPPPTGARKHQRIPSVVLSPSPSSGSPTFEKTIDIPLTLDASTSLPEPMSTYHTTVAKPEFWERLRAFLSAEFPDESDAVLAFEEFLRASKGTLTASEIAKIRDEVGVIGMAGT
ncbi:hypothetical protein PC9H_008600 [Pleurotus ostreatus]|uniref:Ubiquitin-like domain-containing protein n=1 Tax=Pleurotus ostreatus TaxID=5322 RepID=A0A8H6ZP30_PLEOS|nr:uncharacterized protein PC9H_008600 [Pleurotus ostreatus]KAF7426233.1 hypothetical protein PC9H_008600 [Pleurotus ostreatus]KAJ8693698.1 hypothetical protein PTI98_008673 [Pleurotus ostreatus]